MKFTLTLFAFLFAVNVYPQDLPKGFTEYEFSIYPEYRTNYYNYILSDSPDPPPGPVRTMAEWEELQAIQITWSSYKPILRQIITAAQQQCNVIILCSDSNSVKNDLTGNGISLLNVRYIEAPYNTVWCRDYGPWSVYSNDYDTLRIIDWIYNRPRPSDDNSPVYFAQFLNAPLHQTIQFPNDLINAGGNFMTDGHGTGFASKLVLIENPTKTESQIDAIMQEYMGIERYIKMDTLLYDRIHHIDMHMKLLDEETLLVGQYPVGIADGPRIEQNLNYILNNFPTAFGKKYKVVRIPMPPNQYGQYPPQSNYYTYTNSLIVNKTVIVPIYGLQLDSTALQIYRDAMPGYNIVGINSSSMISAYGTIHCITKEIGVNEPIFISHSALTDTNTTSPLEVSAYIKTKSGVQSASLYYTTDTTVAYSQINMTVSNDTFSAMIPSQPLGTKVYYYIAATSNNGKNVNKPLTAPEGYIQFIRDVPVNIRSNNSIVENFRLSQNFPNPFNPVTKIRYEIPQNSFVRLEVFDIAGRLVAQLVNDFKLKGEYEFEFNANIIPSGVYFYRLITPNFSDVKKMVIVK